MSPISTDNLIKYVVSVFLSVQERQCFERSFKYDFVSSLLTGRRLRFLLVLYSASASKAFSTRRRVLTQVRHGIRHHRFRDGRLPVFRLAGIDLDFIHEDKQAGPCHPLDVAPVCLEVVRSEPMTPALGGGPELGGQRNQFAPGGAQAGNYAYPHSAVAITITIPETITTKGAVLVISHLLSRSEVRPIRRAVFSSAGGTRPRYRASETMAENRLPRRNAWARNSASLSTGS